MGFWIWFVEVLTRQLVQTFFEAYLGGIPDSFQVVFEQFFWSKLSQTLSKTLSQKSVRVSYLSIACRHLRVMRPASNRLGNGFAGALCWTGLPLGAYLSPMAEAQSRKEPLGIQTGAREDPTGRTQTRIQNLDPPPGGAGFKFGFR